MKQRIDFMVIGAQKAGTTALYYYLKKHPQIKMSYQKELNFFNRNSQSLLDNNYDSYHHFFDWEGTYLRGEVTPLYICSKKTIEKIHHYNADIQLIAILRNPIERAFSHWNMRTSRKEITYSFSDCLRISVMNMAFPSRFEQMPDEDYIQRGLYAEQIENVYAYFDKSQVLFLKYEDFKKAPLPVLSQIFDFVGIDKERYAFEAKQIHKIEYQTQMSSQEKEILMNIYLPNIQKVENLLGWDCSDWKN